MILIAAAARKFYGFIFEACSILLDKKGKFAPILSSHILSGGEPKRSII